MKPLISCKFNRFDLLLAALVVLCAAAAAFALFSASSGASALTAVITDGDDAPYSVTLDAPRRMTLADGRVTLRIEPDGVCVEYADCPTQSCVRTGKITRAGESIVCLPNRVIVTLEGMDAFDAVMG